MNRFMIALLTLLPLSFLPSGCATLKQPALKVEFYTLEYAPPRARDSKPLPVALRVERFSAAPIYDTGRIIYRDREFRREAYVYDRWRADPADLVAYYLIRDLRECDLFQAVLSRESSISPSHVLEGSVDEFLEWDRAADWQAVLAVSITLVAQAEPDLAKKVLFQKSFRAVKTCKEKNPRGLAEAMSEAMAAVSEEIIRQVYDHLKEE